MDLNPGGIIAWVVIGLVAGWLAGLAMKGGGYGVIADIIVGLVGALIGGFVFGFLVHGDVGFWGAWSSPSSARASSSPSCGPWRQPRPGFRRPPGRGGEARPISLGALATPRPRADWRRRCVAVFQPPVLASHQQNDQRMSTLPAFGRPALRQSDVNSLLRLYDQMKGIAATSPVRQKREWAARAFQHVAAELEKRKVKVN